MCGAPLASNAENAQPMEGNWPAENRNVSRGAQGQQELPAWLESLRAGEMPAAPPKSPSNFSAADLMEQKQGALPTWMDPERGETGEIPLRSAGFPASNTGEGSIPRQGLTANSLIDENSLPSWMRENGQPSQSMPPAQGFQASSLVDANALPEWMRNMQPQTPTSSAQSQPTPVLPPIAQTPQPVSMPSMPAAPQPTPQIPEPTAEQAIGQGLSANSLIDPQALPSWMKEGESGTSGVQSSQPLQAGFSAASLVDPNALPSWMSEGQQKSQQPTGNVANAQPAQGTGISASSFIDVNALPAWMRESDGYTSGNPTGGLQGSALQPGQRGADNMRVPSRPRSEVSATEGSEVAANVFASMLGVASVAPNYPAQPPQGPIQPPQQPGPAPMMGNPSPYMGDIANAPGRMPPEPKPMHQSGEYNVGGALSGPPSMPGGYNTGGALANQGSMSGIMGQPQQQGNSMSGVYNNPYAYGTAPTANQNPYSMGGIAPNSPGMPGNLTPSQGGFGSMPEPPRMEQQKPAKRGLFNAIRELFFR
ncbi:hypothetical protein KSX_17770 [Ktedonospora formicarum]|uniref:Uncharacterized protein n=2 Tax=Ktedonospora formicarum TaxID=2778364 RepID=A0A8J3I2B6_9CHLR|nr:hypothetical protein KSX_17770 [Ktedonospora formicarum]